MLTTEIQTKTVSRNLTRRKGEERATSVFIRFSSVALRPNLQFCGQSSKQVKKKGIQYSIHLFICNRPHAIVCFVNSAGSTQYLAVHKQVPYTSSIVFVLQLWVFIWYVLIDPSKLHYMTSIQIPGNEKQPSIYK